MKLLYPTERIRKGLPINKGVANELSSIGVPGLQMGGIMGGGAMAGGAMGGLMGGLMDGLLGGGEVVPAAAEIELLYSIDSTMKQHLGFYQADAGTIGERHIELTEMFAIGFKGVKDGFDLLLNLTKKMYETGNDQRWKPLFGKQDKQISFLKDIKSEIGKVAKDGGGGGGIDLGGIAKVVSSVKGISTAATGKKVSSPTLMMTGEEGRDEIIIPTERIRKGMPISKDVAKELESIGMPGFQTGGVISGKGKPISKNTATRLESIGVPAYMFGEYGAKPAGDKGLMGKIGGFLGGEGGWSKGVAGGLGAAGLSFGMTLLQGGDMRSAALGAVGAGIGYGATAALSLIPGVGPIIGPILGPMIGSLAGKGLQKLFGKKPPKPKYAKYRGRALKTWKNMF